MQDYFSEFIINPVADIQTSANTLGETKPSSIKTHLVWALVTGGGILLSWKASEKYTEYKMASVKKSKKKSKKTKKSLQ